jgi:hypothetical protein
VTDFDRGLNAALVLVDYLRRSIAEVAPLVDAELDVYKENLILSWVGCLSILQAIVCELNVADGVEYVYEEIGKEPTSATEALELLPAYVARVHELLTAAANGARECPFTCIQTRAMTFAMLLAEATGVEGLSF